MNILDEIKKILDNHECKCYDIDIKGKNLFFNENCNCTDLNSLVVEITGFLLTNDIEYLMDSKNNIKLIV